MKKIISFFAFLAMAAACGVLPLSAKGKKAKAPKYVFYLITDGTGVNTVLGTEYYRAQCEGRLGTKPLCMTSFPVVGVATTYSTSSDVTDSAASGTALATGTKTYNSGLGVCPDSVTPAISVAQRAHDAGYAVGIGTSVPVNHATPAAQYAHAKTRAMLWQITRQLFETEFEFFGGSLISLQRAYTDEAHADTLNQWAAGHGYTITRGLEQYEREGKTAERVVMLQSEDVPDTYSLPYWIDRKPGQMTIVDELRAEIDFLYAKSQQKGYKGFFLMNEVGGKVDFSCHARDGATAFNEVLAVDSCVKVAYEFYLKHPDETLIVVTADHETGGLTLGCNPHGYKINTGVLQYQRASKDEASRHLVALRVATGNKVSWEQVQGVLREDFGFWDKVEITADEEQSLQDVYKRSFEGKMPSEKNLYSETEPLAALAVSIMNDKAHLGWTSSGHTAGLVPVYACGVGQELFMSHNDNAQIPRNIARILKLD